MASMETRSKAKKTLENCDYYESTEFPQGILPTRKDIIQFMLYLLRPKRAGKVQRSKEDAAVMLAMLVQEHWLFCNLYTVTTVSIKKHILSLYNSFLTLMQTRKNRQNENFKKRACDFNLNCNLLFDIFCEDAIQRKKLENVHGLKMSDLEWRFLNDQRNERKMYCEDYIDKKWTKTMERRKQDIQALEKMRSGNEQEGYMVTIASFGSSEESAGETVDETYNASDSEGGEESNRKRRRVVKDFPACGSNDEMPLEYQHVRTSIRKVKDEFYETVDKLKSVYHMSQNQAEAAIIETANKMFGRKWKYHDKSEVIDVDTLPESRNTRLAGKSLEALALSAIVKEIMNSNEKVTVTYSDDGSRKQGAGAFTVQGITINRQHRALPTLSVASESKDNLADLKLTTLNILQAASGVDKNVLFEKIDFVITDQTAHNFGVEDILAEQLNSEKVPAHLFCNVHPSLMFNRVLVKHWARIENVIGRDKIYSNFLVNATTNASSVTEQALDCTTRLINHDFDHKPWNKSSEFDVHISPKQNKSVSLKDERFNRLTLTCAITLFHFNDVSTFLEKYEHVTNQLACIVRCFLELDFLKIMYCVGALIGLHLVEPFLSLTTSTDTRYSKLIPAFKGLYHDLKETEPCRLLNVEQPAFNFVSIARFKQSKYDDDICKAIFQVCEEHKAEITKILRLLLPALAEAFQKQKGDIFGFGDCDEDAQHALATMDPEKLDQAPIHNLEAERSVGFVNYELSRRGAKQLSLASSSQVKAKSSDLIEQSPSGSFKQYRQLVKSGGPLPNLYLEWNKKQQELKQRGLQDKEIANLAVDRRRNKDLDKLKSMGGPFTASDQVDAYLASDLGESEKTGRLYLEVRYARDTSLSLPKTSDIFRLMKDHKKLPLATYAVNLKLYLDNVVSNAQVTIADLNKAIDSMEAPP